MKSIKLLLFNLMLVSIAYAQQNEIISWTMKEWATTLGYNPKGWVSPNALNPNVVTKVQLNVGDSVYDAAKITTSNVPGLSSNTGGVFPDNCGAMFTGTITAGFPPQLIQGFPYVDRPDSISFYIKYEPQGLDTAFMRALLFKRNPGASTKDTIADGYFYTTTAHSSPVRAGLKLNYRTPVPPADPSTDSLVILISSSSLITPQLNSVLYITQMDDVIAGFGKKQKANTIKIYPNPKNTGVLVFENENAQISIYKLCDISGKGVMQGNVNAKRTIINADNLNSGVYFFQTFDNQNNLVGNEKIVISK